MRLNFTWMTIFIFGDSDKLKQVWNRTCGQKAWDVSKSTMILRRVSIQLLPRLCRGWYNLKRVSRHRARGAFDQVICVAISETELRAENSVRLRSALEEQKRLEVWNILADFDFDRGKNKNQASIAAHVFSNWTTQVGNCCIYSTLQEQ